MLKTTRRYEGGRVDYRLAELDEEGHEIERSDDSPITWGDLRAAVEYLRDCVVEDLETHLRSHVQA